MIMHMFQTVLLKIKHLKNVKQCVRLLFKMTKKINQERS